MKIFAVLLVSMLPITALPQAPIKPVAVQAASKPTVKETKPPTISLELTAKFFKIQARQLQAQVDVGNANGVLGQRSAELQGVVAEVNKACGDKFEPNVSPDGDLSCVVKAAKK